MTLERIYTKYLFIPRQFYFFYFIQFNQKFGQIELFKAEYFKFIHGKFGQVPAQTRAGNSGFASHTPKPLDHRKVLQSELFCGNKDGLFCHIV